MSTSDKCRNCDGTPLKTGECHPGICTNIFLVNPLLNMHPLAHNGKVNWNYYVCRGCNRDGDAHMVSLQAKLELCDKCYGEIPREWRQKRGENPSHE